MSRLVFLDTETTSLDDTRGEVWEIGAIVRDADGDTEHLWQVWPNLATADPNSLRIARFYERNLLNGITHPRSMDSTDIALRVPLDGAAVDYPTDTHLTAAVAADLAAVLDGAHVVGAVPDFDYRFLRRFLAKNGQCWTAHYHLIDVEALAVGWLYGRDTNPLVSVPLIPPLPWKSTDLYRAVGVDPDQYEEHTALGDARLVRDVYDAITGVAQAEKSGTDA